jgi:hypothetical protein
VALDYHVDVECHYYSVPHRLLREQVEARITARTIELFHRGERVAVHVRGGARGRHTTKRFVELLAVEPSRGRRARLTAIGYIAACTPPASDNWRRSRFGYVGK